MSQADLSGQLIHLTKGSRPDDYEGAFARLQSILNDRAIRGSSRFIKGGFECVCLSEEPLRALARCLDGQSAYCRYAPFGVILDKSRIWEAGGRKVLYESDSEYEQLPESRRWLHVRFELAADKTIDFTWEREWRIHCRELKFQPSEVRIVVPAGTWRSRLIDDFSRRRDSSTRLDPLAVEIGSSAPPREDFPWQVVAIRDRHAQLDRREAKQWPKKP